MYFLRLVKILVAAALVGGMVLVPQPRAFAQGTEGDPQILAWMQQMNQQLSAQGFDVALGQVELFTIGQGRPITRIMQSGFRFVPGDPRRHADGNKIRYLVDSTADTPFRGDTTSGLTHMQTESVVVAAVNTWQAQQCLSNVTLEKVSVPDGTDPDLIDAFFGFGHPVGQVHLFQADIIHAGWLPAFGPITDTTLGITFTFFFVSNGQPTDINGDGYADTAFTETYYNDNFPWAINQDLPKIDVQSVALHESGHALGLGHFGPPPVAVMNSFYGGPQQVPFPTDDAGLCTLWSSWPQR